MPSTPSFFKEFRSVCWSMARVAAPVLSWTGLCFLVSRRWPIAGILLFYVGVLLGFMFTMAYVNYRSERRRSAGGSVEVKSLLNELQERAGQRDAEPVPTASLHGPPVRMPLDFLQPQPRQLSEVPIGEYAFINFTEVSVDLEGRAWVDTTARTREEVTFMCVKVRPEQGGYHLTLFKRKQEPPPRYTPRALLSSASYAPVLSIQEEELKRV
jgi:hypothetical protein